MIADEYSTDLLGGLENSLLENGWMIEDWSIERSNYPMPNSILLCSGNFQTLNEAFIYQLGKKIQMTAPHHVLSNINVIATNTGT